MDLENVGGIIPSRGRDAAYTCMDCIVARGKGEGKAPFERSVSLSTERSQDDWMLL